MIRLRGRYLKLQGPLTACRSNHRSIDRHVVGIVVRVVRTTFLVARVAGLARELRREDHLCIEENFEGGAEGVVIGIRVVVGVTGDMGSERSWCEKDDYVI